MNFNDTEKNVTFECEGATDGDLEWFEDFSYCIGGVCQLVLGRLCTKNCIFEPVLCDFFIFKYFKTFFAPFRLHWIFG